MHTSPATPAWQPAAMAQAVHLRNQINSGLGWFQAVAGLTLLNALLWRSGLQLSFVVGLAAGQLVDVFSTALAAEFDGGTGLVINGLGFALSLVLAAIFLLPWWLGRRGQRWAVVAGMVAYALDTLLLVVFTDWLGLAFHAWGLFGMSRSWKAMGELKKLEVAQGSPLPTVAMLPGVTAVAEANQPALTTPMGVEPEAETHQRPAAARVALPVSAEATLGSVLFEPITWLAVVPALMIVTVAAGAALNDSNPAWVVLTLFFLTLPAVIVLIALRRRIEVGLDGVRYSNGTQQLLIPWGEVTRVAAEPGQRRITFWMGTTVRRVYEFGLPRSAVARVRQAIFEQFEARRIPLR